MDQQRTSGIGPPHHAPAGSSPGARLLLLYSDSGRAALIIAQLADRARRLVSWPLELQEELWRGAFEPDLVLLDPPGDRRHLVQTCAAIRARVAQPLVVLSEEHGEGLVEAALAAGVDEYLVLPLGERELHARIDALRRRARGYPIQQEAPGGVVLLQNEMAAERDGRKVFLSPIEFRLLAALVSSPGRVITHDALMSRVWGPEYVDSRHYLHLYVRYLREKLEDDPRNPRLIVSEWGVGYRFAPGSAQ